MHVCRHFFPGDWQNGGEDGMPALEMTISSSASIAG